MTEVLTEEIRISIYPDTKNFNEALNIDKPRAIEIMKDVISLCKKQGNTKEIDGVKLIKDLLPKYKDNEYIFSLISFFAIANPKIK